MPVPAPTAETRWRCTLCGNLTRFDVRRTTRATEFVHVTLGGDQVVEERSVLADTVEHVTCRWCGRVDAVELVPRADAGPGARGPASVPEVVGGAGATGAGGS
jgi:hypothetical protein